MERGTPRRLPDLRDAKELAMEKVEQEEVEVVETPQEGVEGQPASEQSGEDQGVVEEKADDLPEWARKRLTKANDEAAKYRLALRDAQASLGKAKSPEEYEALQSRLAELESAAKRRELVAKVGKDLPDVFRDAEWIAWPDDEKGVKALAAEIREAIGVLSAPARRGGSELRGGVDPTSDDPGELDYRTLASAVRKSGIY